MSRPLREVSITEIMDCLRRAYVGLIPMLDVCGLSWRTESASDQWDAISEALYCGLVVDTIEWDGGSQSYLTFSGYGVHTRNYKEVSFIEVHHSSLGADETASFERFDSTSTFESLEVVVLNQDFRPVRSATLAMNECNFLANIPLTQGRQQLQMITIVE